MNLRIAARPAKFVRNQAFRPLKNPGAPVDIPGLIWYIRAFDGKGVAFVGPSSSPEFHD